MKWGNVISTVVNSMVSKTRLLIFMLHCSFYNNFKIISSSNVSEA